MTQPGFPRTSCTKVRTYLDSSAPHFADGEERTSVALVSKARAKGRLPISKILPSFLLLCLASCSNQGDQFQKRMQGILSWSATAEMILDARLKAIVPNGFTDLAVERCQTEISDLSSQLPQTSEYGPVRESVLELDRLIAAAHDEIGKGDFEQARRRLAEIHQREVELRVAAGAGQ